MYEALAILAIFTMVYSVVAGRLERTWISGPMVFITFGWLIGPHGLRIIPIGTSAEILKSMAELTLALVLFTDAAGADLGVLRRVEKLPIRLLAAGLPLTILLGYAVGEALFAELGVLELALLATMLAPTDAALGKPVITNKAVPAPVRQGLNVESGLNDGVCVPILLLFLDLTQDSNGSTNPWRRGLGLFAAEVGIGLATGLVLTTLAAALLWLSKRNKWQSPTWIKIPVMALALACFGTAQTLGGSGFIASFSAGLLFGGLLRTHREKLLGAAEGIGDTFSLLTWVLFGAAVVGRGFLHLDWRVALYAALSLTVIRMLPVFLVLSRLRVSTEGKLFIGWFGPRGLASIVFVVMVLETNPPHHTILRAAVASTVILSILAHGVTANAWARRYGQRAKLSTAADRLDR